MRKFLNWLDEIAQTNQENTAAKWLERIAFFFLILMVLSAPHSIAATQTAWITGMFAWLVRLFIAPRPKFFRTKLDLPLWIFFGWSVITALTSYAPDISIDKLRGVALFLIFYFVINQLKSLRAVKFLAIGLVFSCMFNVLWTPLERIIGRGVEIYGVAPNSPLTKAIYVENNNEPIVLKDGDTLVKIGKKKIHTPEDLLSEIEQNETTSVQFYRPDYYLTVQIKRADLLNGTTANEKLGFTSWKKSRNWRSAGFYGHWTTYGEVLQLILSLTFGLFIASISVKRLDEDEKANNPPRQSFLLFTFYFLLRKITFSPILLFCVAAMSLALLLNVTRASQIGFLVSTFAIVFVVKRKMVLVLAVIFLPLVLGGLLFLQQSRNVGFFDTNDDSVKYRQTVYREGFDLWTANARHFSLGVGMDSIKRYAKDWHLFDDGKLPQGHFHSTLLQLVVERGLPALLLWLWILWIYARTLLRYFRFQIPNSKFQNSKSESRIEVNSTEQSGVRHLEFGIVLGIFGGLIGFFTSGSVHYNLGDAEVAMVFFLLMAFGVFIADFRLENKINLKSAI
jgi:O-Antigen ligase